MRNYSLRAFVWAMAYIPFFAEAQTTAGSPLPGGLDKPITVLNSLQLFLITAGGILVSISLIGCGVAMSFYKRQWHDLQAPVIGGIVIGFAVAFSSWLVR